MRMGKRLYSLVMLGVVAILGGLLAAGLIVPVVGMTAATGKDALKWSLPKGWTQLPGDGMRFATLKPGTASEFVIKAMFKKGYKTDYEALKKKGWTFEFTSYENGADLMADNHLDLFAFSVGKVASIVMNIESSTPIYILPLGQQALDALAAAYGTTTFTVEPGIYKSVKTPVKTIGDYTCIVVRKDLPDNLVYDLNKAMWANKASLALAVQDFNELNPKEALPSGVPAHPGSEQFWKTVK